MVSSGMVSLGSVSGERPWVAKRRDYSVDFENGSISAPILKICTINCRNYRLKSLLFQWFRTVPCLENKEPTPVPQCLTKAVVTFLRTFLPSLIPFKLTNYDCHDAYTNYATRKNNIPQKRRHSRHFYQNLRLIAVTAN